MIELTARCEWERRYSGRLTLCMASGCYKATIGTVYQNEDGPEPFYWWIAGRNKVEGTAPTLEEAKRAVVEALGGKEVA